jgi:DNA-binding PadR family transcriptional regulator
MSHKHGFGWGFPFFESNALEYLVLDSIKNNPGQGHDIIRNIEEKCPGFFRPDMESVSATLKMLADMGYVSVSEPDGKKTYTITQEGKEHLIKHYEVVNRFSCCWQDRREQRYARGFARHHSSIWI